MTEFYSLETGKRISLEESLIETKLFIDRMMVASKVSDSPKCKIRIDSYSGLISYGETITLEMARAFANIPTLDIGSSWMSPYGEKYTIIPVE